MNVSCATLAAKRLRLVPSQGGLAQFRRNRGLAQAVFVFAEPVTLKVENVPTRIYAVGESGYNPYSVLLATNDRFLRANPDVVRRFVRAVRRGWETYLKSPEDTNADLARLNPAMSLKAMNIATEMATPYVRGKTDVLGRMQRTRRATLGQQLVEIGALDTAPDPEGCFHNPE